MEILRVFVFFGLSFSVFSSVPRSDYGEVKIFQSPATYYVESMVMLNEAARKDKEVGYKIIANLDVQAVWGVDTDFLLKFVLNSPKLHSKGKLATSDYLPINSFWDTYYRSTFYAHWKNGLIEEVYLNPEDVSDVLNYQKSLISLFQFKVIDGEHNETDVSGICDVLYDSVSMEVIRKTKRRCYTPGAEEQILSGEIVSSKQLIRYSFNKKLDTLEEIYGEEVHTVGFPNLGDAIKARAWMRLKREGSPSASNTIYTSLESALEELPAKLKLLSLPMLLPDEPFDDEMTLEEALREAVREGEAEEAGGGGDAEEAAAAMRALRALRSANATALAAAIRAAPDQRSLAVLSRLLGASGTAAAHEAASRELHLGAPDAPPPALLYLSALALAPQPHDAVVAAAARLGAEAAPGPIREAALLAAAAAAARLPAASSVRAALRDQLVRHLARCMEEECRELQVRALGNLRAPDAAAALLERAEAGGGDALAALRALAALPPDALRGPRMRRLAALAAPPRSLELRAAALDLLLERAAPLPPPLLLARVAHDLHAHGPSELRRLFWQRARQLAEEHPPLAQVLARLPHHLRGWDALALSGTSSLLVREVGELGAGGPAGGAGRATLTSLQLARGGLLRRGRVQLLDARAPKPLLEMELWTRGLEALAGAEAEAEAEEGAEEEGTSGGLELGVGGARLPGVALFAGQAELLGHVWAGRGSEPTRVLRALLPLGERRARLPLLGAGPLQLRAAHVLTLALDAHAQVSLWSRTARAGLELRVGGAGEAAARLGALAAAVRWQAQPRLRVPAELDAHGRTALCVRAHSLAQARESRAWLRSALWPHVRRARSAAWALPGRSLALGALNDAACRDLAP